MQRWKIPALCVLTFLLPVAARAELNANAGLSLAWPQSEFSEHVNFAFGGGGRAGWAFSRNSAVAPVLFVDLGYLNYGRERRVEPFSLTIPDVAVDVVTDNFMFLVSPGFSIGLRRGPVRPYAETFFGLTYIATRTSINNHGLIGGNEPIAQSTNLSDFTYNLGLGGGVLIPVWHGQRQESKRQMESPQLSEVLIDLKLDYILGGNAEYLKKGSIRRDSGFVEYDTIRSATDMLQVRIGASFMF